MDSKRVSEYLGIPYGQMNYMLRKVNGLLALKWGASQGKSREYTSHDLTRLRLALLLKSDGYETPVIQKAIDELNKNWNGESPDNAGGLLAVSDNAFTWASDTSMELSGGGISAPISLFRNVPKFFYNVKRIAGEFYEQTP